MVKFDIKSPQERIGIVKGTVHKNGKLGFSSGAAEMMNLGKNRYFQVATNSEDASDENIYMIEAKEGDGRAFKVGKAGSYYYLRIKNVLDEMNVNYEKEKIIYDIIKVDDQDIWYYKLKRRKTINRKE